MKKASDIETIAEITQNWLGNRLTRLFLRFFVNRMEVLLLVYSGADIKLDFRDKIAYVFISRFLGKASKIFDIPEDELKSFLKKTYFRRAIVNVVKGIAEFGVQTPQTTAAPFLIVWDLTKKCNLRCKHCYQDSNSYTLPDELTTEEAKKIIDELADAGVVAIAFSGGEPLLRQDFFEIARYAKEKDFHISIATNATLITPKIAKELKKIVDYIEISLDGFEKTHDGFRGIPGIWKRTCQGIKNCIAAGIDTCIACTVTKWNYKEIPDFIKWVENELKPNRMIFFNFIPTRRGKDIADQDISPQERENLLKFLYSKLLDKNCPIDIFSTAPQFSRISMESIDGPVIVTHFTDRMAMQNLKGKTKSLAEFIGGCGAGRIYAALEPNGDIYPCVFIPLKIGNIRQNRFLDIWKNSEVLKKIRDRAKFKGNCGVCQYRNICGGCRARAYGYFGDLQGPDPGCIHNIKYWDAIKGN
ncbi:MAG: radical SAM protein [Candidatus Aenigmatarchaeota archaeon]